MIFMNVIKLNSVSIYIHIYQHVSYIIYNPSLYLSIHIYYYYIHILFIYIYSY